MLLNFSSVRSNGLIMEVQIQSLQPVQIWLLKITDHQGQSPLPGDDTGLLTPEK
jgi:hypothetical protein